MNFFLSLLNAMPGAITQGMLWGIMANRRVHHLPHSGRGRPDGGRKPCHRRRGVRHADACRVESMGRAAVRVSGGCAGGTVCTGLLHTRCGIPAILAGILTQLALYSVNLRIMTGKANQPIGVDKYDLLVSQRYVRDLALNNPIPLVILFLAVLIGLLYWFFGTEYGSSLRATGANQNMARAQGIDTKSGITFGLMLANGLVAMAGGLLAQYQGAVDEHGTGRHRHRPCRRYHRRGAAGTRVPQFRAEAGVRRHRRGDLLRGHPDRSAARPEHQ